MEVFIFRFLRSRFKRPLWLVILILLLFGSNCFIYVSAFIFIAKALWIFIFEVLTVFFISNSSKLCEVVHDTSIESPRFPISTRVYIWSDLKHVYDVRVWETWHQVIDWYKLTVILSRWNFWILITLLRALFLPINFMYRTLLHWMHLEPLWIIAFFIQPQTVLLIYFVFFWRQQIDSYTSFDEARLYLLFIFKFF